MDAKKRLVESLTILGEESLHAGVQASYMSKTNPNGHIVWRNRLGNLMDSMVSAVYLDGKLQENSIRYANNSPISMSAEKRMGKTGRQLANEYIRKVHPRGKDSVVLLLVAAVGYAQYLESGTYINGGVGRELQSTSPWKIKIISSARAYANANYEKAVEDVYVRFGLPRHTIRAVKGDVRTYRNW